MIHLGIFGAQWGDEGKGKITDYLASRFLLVARFQGGNNAGHTIWIDGKKTVLHTLPSGLMQQNTQILIGHGVVVNPILLWEEIQKVGESTVKKRLMISDQASVITPYQIVEDILRESDSAKAIGTTKKGIGPTYSLRAARNDLRFGMMMQDDVLKNKLQEFHARVQMLAREQKSSVEIPSVDQVFGQLKTVRENMREFVADTFAFLQAFNGRVLYEGAQGVLLDVDYGYYPYITSSNTHFSSIYSGCGVKHGDKLKNLGVFKPYITRVGAGPMPTTMPEDENQFFVKAGEEFGATTGRERRCGYLDLPLLKYSCQVGHFDALAVTKTDILDGRNEIKVCVAYEWKGQKYDAFSPSMRMEELKPIYEMIKLEADTNPEKRFQHFITKVEKAMGMPVAFVSYGKDRNQILERVSIL